MNQIAQAAAYLLSDLGRFSTTVVGTPLHGYQLRPLEPIVDSVLHRRGREFLLVFPRQSGKNEAVAQLLVYLMNVLQQAGGSIVWGAVGNQLTLAEGRLAQRLDNAWNMARWNRRSDPTRLSLGRVEVVFLSTDVSAHSRGFTAHWLLVIDEAQSQDAATIESVFTPMRAAYNASALYIGTVKTTADFLWQKKAQLEQEERDGHQRVWLVGPEEVCADNPRYHLFLDAQVSLFGRHHPIVASEYYLEPMDAASGLFDARRQALMRGTHARISSPPSVPPVNGGEGRLYVATLDLAGEDEAPTDPLGRLDNPGRDYTVATVFKVDFSGPPSVHADVPSALNDGPVSGGEGGTFTPGLPVYRAVDVFVDHGSKHFQNAQGTIHNAQWGIENCALSIENCSLVDRLLAWLRSWQVAHVVADESGVGLGVVSALKAALGEGAVTGFTFTPSSKAALGSAFLSLVETGRFKYWSGDGDVPLSDGWWFWKQVEACGYQLPAGGVFEQKLRWGVPAAHRTSTPVGSQPTHDDRLVSAALVAELDAVAQAGRLRLGLAQSTIIRPVDPLKGEIY